MIRSCNSKGFTKYHSKLAARLCKLYLVLFQIGNFQWMFQVESLFISLDDFMCKDEALMHICIHPRWLHRQKPTGFLYHCEFVKTWCMSRCIIMCTLCSLSLCAKWAVLKCIIVKKIDIKTIGVFSVAPLRCFQLVYFILFPPCCFCSVTYKLSANNFSNILQNIWYEICPKWKQKRLIIWITACNDCSLVFFCITEQLYQYLDTTKWETSVNAIFKHLTGMVAENKSNLFR